MSVIMQEGLRAVIIFDSDGIFRGFVGIVKIIITAKFPELSQNFPKLADWAVLGRSLCLAELGAGIFKQGTFLLHIPVQFHITVDYCSIVYKTLIETTIIPPLSKITPGSEP